MVRSRRRERAIAHQRRPRRCRPAADEGADNVELLSRPLLDALRDLTGLASAYLTVVHQDDDVQEIRYARNTREGFEVPEGLFVPWGDTLGRAAGDAVLIQVGHRLRSVARPHDLVARLGGDEFLVAARLPRDAAAPLVERLGNALSFSLPWQSTSIDVRGSVGVALSEGHDGPSLIAAADAAMYDEKSRRRSATLPT